MAYATAEDMLLGDVEVPSTANLDAYLTRASNDIDIALSKRYSVPLTLTDFGVTVIKNVCADLASAYYIMATAQGTEDGHVNAYALHLYNRAVATLAPYVAGEELLPGAAVITLATPTDPNPTVAIKQEDSTSLLSPFYRYVGDPWAYPLPTQPPAVRPYI